MVSSMVSTWQYNITGSFYSLYNSSCCYILDRSFHHKLPFSEFLRIEPIKVDPTIVRRHHFTRDLRNY